MTGALLTFSIKNFRGIVELKADPNGKSLTFRGKNGAGKSSAIDALFFGLGGTLDGEVVTNGAERAEVDIHFGDYVVRRIQTRGKPPKLSLKTADGKAELKRPTEVLSAFVGAIERQTFSARRAKDQAEILRRLAPGLDCADLDQERAQVHEERTEVNRAAKQLRAQAEGVVVPADVPFPGEEQPVVDAVDVAEVAAKKGEVEKQRAANAQVRALLAGARAGRERAEAEVAQQEAHLAELDKRVAQARIELGALAAKAVEARRAVSDCQSAIDKLVDPDTSAIDSEIAEAKKANALARAATEAHNRAVRAAHQQQQDVLRARAERERLGKQAAAKEAEAAALTAAIDRIDTARASRIAAAKLPIAGLALAGEVVTLDDGVHGPVEVGALNTAARIRLDVVIAATLGHRLIAVRDASLLDSDQWSALNGFAAQHQVQLLGEVVASGEALSVEIVEAADDGEATSNAELPL